MIIWCVISLLVCSVFRAQPAHGLHKPSTIFMRLIREYEKLKGYELQDHIEIPTRRNHISKVLATIIQDEEQKKHIARLKKNKSKKTNIPWQNNYYAYSYPYQMPASSAVDSITFTPPQLVYQQQAVNGELLNRMQEITVADRKEINERRENITKTNTTTLVADKTPPKIKKVQKHKAVHVNPERIAAKRKGIVSESSPGDPVGLISKDADKESDNPHPQLGKAHVNHFTSIYKQAHEGNDTDDVDDLPSLQLVHLKSSQLAKINPNPHPDVIQSSLDPLRVVSLKHSITNEEDEASTEQRDKTSVTVKHDEHHEKQNKTTSKLLTTNRQSKKVLKPPDNKSLASSHDDIDSDPLQFLNIKKINGKHKAKIRRPAKTLNIDNWADRRSHALALLAKLASDLEQPDIVDNVLSALGVGDIINLDNPTVQHDDLDSDDFKDKNWVDEELGGNSGSGDHLISLNDIGKKHATHRVQVIQDSFIKGHGASKTHHIVKGQPKDMIVVNDDKNMRLENLVDESL